MAGNRAVVCDDDELIRSVIRRVLADVGYEVVAEVDNPQEAIEGCRRGNVDVVVLDLALRAGHGEQVLDELAADGGGTRAIVFSAYVNAPDALLDKGAAAVIDKPNFDQLEEAATALLERSGNWTQERRRAQPKPIQPMPPATGLTISGFEPWASFGHAIESLLHGDALLAVDVVPDLRHRELWDHVFRMDARVALARAVRTTLRTQDRISVAPSGVPIVALVGGHLEAPGSVFDRLEATWKREVATDTPIGAFTHVSTTLEPADAVTRVLDALEREDLRPDHPLRMV